MELTELLCAHPRHDQPLDLKQEAHDKCLRGAGMGEVAAVGEGVSGLEVGQRVTGAPWSRFEQVTDNVAKRACQ